MYAILFLNHLKYQLKFFWMFFSVLECLEIGSLLYLSVYSIIIQSLSIWYIFNVTFFCKICHISHFFKTKSSAQMLFSEFDLIYPLLYLYLSSPSHIFFMTIICIYNLNVNFFLSHLFQIESLPLLFSLFPFIVFDVTLSRVSEGSEVHFLVKGVFSPISPCPGNIFPLSIALPCC